MFESTSLNNEVPVDLAFLGQCF